MEGVSRPGFFRGVATVVIKLFNIVQASPYSRVLYCTRADPSSLQPTHAYFGQKDIQQALLLRRMLTDLHVPAPLASNLVIIPTYRDQQSSLALSSRNAYLRPDERPWATVLVDALKEGERVWNEQRARGNVSVKEVLEAARESVRRVEKQVQQEGEGVEVKLIYIAMNDPEELWDLEKEEGAIVPKGKGAVLSGAVMLGRTRLIDNLVFDYPLN